MNQTGLVIPEVVLQHADEAAFLWLQRTAAVSAPHYSLADLARLDERVEAHLDGLRIAGVEGWKVCSEALKWEEAGEIFTAASLAAEIGDSAHLELILKVVAARPAMADGLVGALGWLTFGRAENYARRFLDDNAALIRRVGLAAYAVHRRDPGQSLRNALRSADPLERGRAFQAAGELGRAELVSELRGGLSADDPELRFQAAWSAAVLSEHGDAVSALQTIAETPGPRQEQAMGMAMRRLAPGVAKEWQKKLSRNPAHLRMANIGAGALGDPELMPWLLQQMKVPPVARVAGEAFSIITGVGLSYQNLEADSPEGFQAGPTEDPADENVAMDADENLAWPDPALIGKWWSQHQSEFPAGTRHLCGKPITPEWLQTVLRDGFQRARAAAALELTIRQPGTQLFNVKAPGFRQLEVLGKPGPVIR